MTGDVTIRPTTEVDDPLIIALALAFASTLPPWAPVLPSEVARLVQSYGTLVGTCLLVAEREGELEGFLAGELLPYFLNQDVKMAHERAFYVRESSQRQGMGTALLGAFEAWSQAQGASAVVLSRFAQTLYGETMYTTHGYAPFEIHYVKEL